MSESNIHIKYVCMLEKQVKNMINKDNYVHILIDSPYSKNYPPLIMNNFRPDLYYNYDNILIIGEAKTDDDFNRSHSIQQYISYFQECLTFRGKAVIILSGSWKISSAWANLMRNIRRNGKFISRVVIINELGVYREIM